MDASVYQMGVGRLICLLFIQELQSLKHVIMIQVQKGCTDA